MGTNNSNKTLKSLSSLNVLEGFYNILCNVSGGHLVRYYLQLLRILLYRAGAFRKFKNSHIDSPGALG